MAYLKISYVIGQRFVIFVSAIQIIMQQQQKTIRETAQTPSDFNERAIAIMDITK